MFFLFQLNKYFLVPFLTEWLESHDLWSLDLSLNRISRKCYDEFLNEFRERFEAVYETSNNTFHLSTELLSSINRRGFILPSSCIITEHFLSQLKSDKQLTTSSQVIDFTPSVLDYLHRLKSIHIYMCSKNVAGLLNLLLYNCSSIDNVMIHCCVDVNYPLNVIINHCKGLVALNVSGQLLDTRLCVIQRLLNRSPKLKLLHLQSTNGFLEYFAESLFSSVTTSHPRLLDLKLIGMEGRIKLGANGQIKKFTSLSFDSFGVDSLQRFLLRGGGEALVMLDVSKCYFLTNVSLTMIGTHCRSLNDLRIHIRSCNADGFDVVARSFSQLTSFHALGWTNKVEVAIYMFIARRISAFCPLLENLSVPCDVAEMNSAFPRLRSCRVGRILHSTRFASFLTSCTALVSLTVGNKSMKSDTFSCPKWHQDLIKRCTLTRILALDYELLFTLSDAQRLSQLIEVGLSLHFDSIVDLLEGCTRLRRLVILCNVTSQSTDWDRIVNLGGRLHSLELLSCPFDGKVTVAPQTIRKWITKCSKLRSLMIRGKPLNVLNMNDFLSEMRQLNQNCLLNFERINGSSDVEHEL